MESIELQQFSQRLPKIELHAHLSGSIRRQTLHEIWLTKKLKDPGFPLEDPMEVIPANGFNDIAAFFTLFSKYIYLLCNDVDAVTFSTYAVLKEFDEDGVVHLELRTTPRDFSETGMTKEDYVKTVLKTIETYEQSTKSTMKTTLILSIDRRDSPEKAQQCLDLALRYKDRGVVGMDLCGDPWKGDIHSFRGIFAEAKAAGLKITLHFAEAAETSSDDELFTLLSYQPDRLGHVIHISDAVKREISSKKIPLELCISCNIQVKMHPDVKCHGDHHFGEWWKEKTCPLVICTDDVGVFFSTCSNEYYIVAKNFGLSKKELWELSFGAIEAVFGDEARKEMLREAFLTWKINEGL
ncbi:hypothetical protein BDD12DRAFT_943045 [Trichophaea hybrida]|nr:hypothetical protein BDD12DRAFT_943045 [Trichophaea hybrida]